MQGFEWEIKSNIKFIVPYLCQFCLNPEVIEHTVAFNLSYVGLFMEWQYYWDTPFDTKEISKCSIYWMYLLGWANHRDTHCHWNMNREPSDVNSLFIFGRICIRDIAMWGILYIQITPVNSINFICLGLTLPNLV